MRLEILFLIALPVTAILFGGCAVRQGDFTVMSSRSVNLDRVDLDKLPQVRGITGKTTKPVFLFFPIGQPALEDALDDALDKGNGDVMTDAVVHVEFWTVILFGAQTIRVKGTVINSKGDPR